jgi:hypothetical protein
MVPKGILPDFGSHIPMPFVPSVDFVLNRKPYLSRDHIFYT